MRWDHTLPLAGRMDASPKEILQHWRHTKLVFMYPFLVACRMYFTREVATLFLEYWHIRFEVLIFSSLPSVCRKLHLCELSYIYYMERLQTTKVGCMHGVTLFFLSMHTEHLTRGVRITRGVYLLLVINS